MQELRQGVRLSTLGLVVVICWALGISLYWYALKRPRDEGFNVYGIFGVTFMLMGAIGTVGLVLWAFTCALAVCR